MEMDYHDVALNGMTRDGIVRFFDRLADAGIGTIIWSTAACGRAEYPSRIQPMYDGGDRRIHSQRAAELMRSFDGLAFAVEQARKRNITLLALFRLSDDYWRGMEESNLDRMQNVWWQSRCGQLELRGVPCYAVPEVRQYKLKLVREINDYGVDGFVFGLTRLHGIYVSPYRQPDFWGYNIEWVNEYKKRYGVDLREFERVIEHPCENTPGDKWGVPFINRFEYVGAAEFDHRAWHMLKGESASTFVAEARSLIGPDKHVAVEAHHLACPPTDRDDDDYPLRQFFFPTEMAREGVVNEWITSDNWRSRDFQFDEILCPHFDAARSANLDINIWMNDLFSPTGGHGQQHASLADIRQYLDAVRASSIRSATIHEADFMLQHPEVDAIWAALKQQ
jgi:hypothetical protein